MGWAGSSKRWVVARQAERHATVRGPGNVGVEREMLLYGVRVAEGARRMAGFVQSRGAGEAEHHVDRAHRPVHGVGALEAVTRYRCHIRDFSIGYKVPGFGAIAELRGARG